MLYLYRLWFNVASWVLRLVGLGSCHPSAEAPTSQVHTVSGMSEVGCEGWVR